MDKDELLTDLFGMRDSLKTVRHTLATLNGCRATDKMPNEIPHPVPHDIFWPINNTNELHSVDCVLDSIENHILGLKNEMDLRVP